MSRTVFLFPFLLSDTISLQPILQYTICNKIQIKHKDDEEWSNFTAEEARKEMSAKNIKKAKESKIFQFPVLAEADKEIARTNGGLSGQGWKSPRREPTSQPSYVPPQRPTRGWIPSQRGEASRTAATDREEEETEMT